MNDDLDRRLQELLAERGEVEPDAVDRALGAIDRLPERRRPSSPARLAAAAVIALALIGLGLAVALPRPADVATPSPSPSIPSQAPSPSIAATTPEPTPTVQPRPVWAMNLADHLDCDGPPSTIGMDVPSVPVPFDPATTPDGALDNILLTYRTLPASGYLPVLVDGHWALHRYLVDGRARVHIVSTNLFPEVPSETRWEVVGLRACNPSEFAEADLGPDANTIWRDAAGDPVRTDVITSRVGPGSVVPFDADARLPADATDTGFHTDDWHLFTIPSGRVVFVRTADVTIERWPRAKEPIGCA